MRYAIVMVNPWSTDEPEAVIGPFESMEAAKAARHSELGDKLWGRDAICSGPVPVYGSLEKYEAEFKYVTDEDDDEEDDR